MELLYFNHICSINTYSFHLFYTTANSGYMHWKDEGFKAWWRRLRKALKVLLHLTPLRQSQTSLFLPSSLLSIPKIFLTNSNHASNIKTNWLFILLNSYVSLGTSLDLTIYSKGAWIFYLLILQSVRKKEKGETKLQEN